MESVEKLWKLVLTEGIYNAMEEDGGMKWIEKERCDG